MHWGPNKGGTTSTSLQFFYEGFIIFKNQRIPYFPFSKAVNFVFHLLKFLKDNQSQIMASV